MGKTKTFWEVFRLLYYMDMKLKAYTLNTYCIYLWGRILGELPISIFFYFMFFILLTI